LTAPVHSPEKGRGHPEIYHSQWATHHARSVLHVDPPTEIENLSATEEVLSGIRLRQW